MNFTYKSNFAFSVKRTFFPRLRPKRLTELFVECQMCGFRTLFTLRRFACSGVYAISTRADQTFGRTMDFRKA